MAPIAVECRMRRGASQWAIFVACAALIFLAGGVNADDDCTYGSFAINDGYWFGGESEDGGFSILTDIASKAACQQTAMCVEVQFPADDVAVSYFARRRQCPLAREATGIDAGQIVEISAHPGDLDDDCFVRFAHLAFQLKVREVVPVLEKELGSGSWTRALAAAVALRDFGDMNADAWRAAGHHWYPPVRLIAQEALAGERDEIALHPNVGDNDLHGRLRVISESYDKRFCSSQQLSWTAQRNAIQPSLPGEQSFTFKPLEQVQGWPICRPVSARRSFAGGLLVGSGMGEWGGAVYFFRAPELPRPLFEDVVQSVHVMGNKAMAVAGIAHGGLSYTTVYAIQADRQNVPVASVMAELPEDYWRMNWRDDGSAVIVGNSGVVYQVLASTHPRVLGCVKNLGRYDDSPPWVEPAEPFED